MLPEKSFILKFLITVNIPWVVNKYGGNCISRFFFSFSATVAPQRKCFTSYDVTLEQKSTLKGQYNILISSGNETKDSSKVP